MKFLSIGADITDSEALRLKKSSLVFLPVVIGPTALVWGSLYAITGHYIPAAIPLFYAIVSMLGLWHFNKTHNVVPLYYVQMTLVLFLPFVLMWLLGGFAASSYVMIWAFYTPIAALVYDREEKAHYWFYLFILLVVFSFVIDEQILYLYPELLLPSRMIELFYVLNITGGFAGIHILFRHFIYEYTNSMNSDYLTGMYNRRYFYEVGKAIVDKNQRKNKDLVVATLDIDNFKEINDKYGHNVGDLALKEVSTVLNKSFRSSDLIARFGGEEFCILLEDFSYEDMQKLFERVRHSFEINEMQLENKLIKYTISIGVSYGMGEDIDEMLKLSDQALYEAKENGKNRVCIHQFENRL